ncbi:MAG: dihydropteroate synthase [Pseudomonadota bacterium]
MATKAYFRPVIEGPGGAGLRLCGGWARFSTLERIERGGLRRFERAEDAPASVLDTLTTPRPPLWPGHSAERPALMAILNTTPDSFSDGGQFVSPEDAVARGLALDKDGADLIDIGGESTRPGAAFVEAEEESARVLPVIRDLRAKLPQMPLSIDTRKPHVAQRALAEGASFYNDVSALTYDRDAGVEVLRAHDAPICLMHSSATPDVMQQHTSYEDVVLDVYDWLEAQVAALVNTGLDRARIVVDPGIGFGKTLDQNLALVHNLSLFHGLGCALLLGASRKRFIGTLTGTAVAEDRLAGSLAVALEGARQGAQILRVHDVKETAQALSLWAAVERQAQ